MKSLANYRDVEQVLETAYSRGGITYTLPTHNLAVSWRQRAYTYRGRLRKADEPRAVYEGRPPRTKYDDMMITFLDKSEDCNVLKIAFAEMKGVIGELPNASSPEPEDDPFAAAEAILRGNNLI